MSLTKLLLAPIKLFKKDVITFLIIRRHDLGTLEDILRYIAVKPTATISMLRQKVWYLLDLPDYCEEVIVLKTSDNVEMPLTELRNGNDPQHAYILEVWLPGKRFLPTTMHNNMLTMGTENGATIGSSSDSTCGEKTQNNLTEKFVTCNTINSQTTMSNETLALNKFRFTTNQRSMQNFIQTEYKKSELSCRISNSSLIFKLQGRKSKDNFASILLKIQNDLSLLSQKLSNLENRIPT